MDHDSLRRGEPRVPGYRIEGVLGRGATGTVYRARQISVDRVVALKVLHPELVGAKRAELRLQREARTTARLAHPNIISAFDMGEVDGMWWYAMELVDGVSLAEKIRERPLSEREALRVFIPLVEALQHAFERGVVHRDVKPANILVERGGRALLVDLGLAYSEDDPALTKGGGTLGTPHYISPEQARDPSSADAQSDIWSLGATMYHAVCGRPPFSGDSVAEILSSVLYERVSDPRDHAPALSNGFVLVLRKCLTRDRALRYATPAELLADLERIRERRSPSVRRRALEPLAQHRRRLARVIASVVLVACVVTFLGWLALRERDPRLVAQSDGGGDGRSIEAPLAPFERAVSGPPAGLASALERADVLLRTRALPDVELARLEILRADLDRRLRSEESAYRQSVAADVKRLLAERRFHDADDELATAFPRGMRLHIGTGTLPEDVRAAQDAWRAAQAELVAGARRDAVAALDAALSADFDRRIAPRVDELVARGAWRSARALLTSEAREWIQAADVPRTGLEADVIEASTARLLSGKVAARREALDVAWGDTDRALVAAIEARVKSLRDDLEARAVVDAPARLRQTFNDALASRSLTLDEMPAGLLHLGHEAVTRGESELLELEKRLSVEDARRGFDELELENADAWKARRYADVARSFTAALRDPWRAPVRTELEVRAREARALQDLLARAALEIGRREGERVELRVGSIQLAGTLSSSTDLLRTGFKLTLDSGRVYALALRPVDVAPTSGPAPVVLGPEEVARFAGLPAEGTPQVTPADRLLRALFLMREGDVLGARASLNAGPLPRDEALVADIEARLRLELEHLQAAEGERRGEALELLYLVRRENQGGTSGEALEKRIERLLQEYGDVLGDEEIRELRRMRDERFGTSTTPAGDLTAAQVFRPANAEELPGPRVRMRFDFDGATAGAFESGSWIPEGSGWSGLRYARSDEELLSRPCPTLALKDPLRVQSDPIDVRIKFDQLPDAPAELLFVSCAGVHVALSFQADGTKGRCFVDTTDAAAALARSRAGEGKECAGWKPGAPLEVRLLIYRARGVAVVDLDGKRIGEFQKPAPRGDASSSKLEIRSWEPVRLRSVTIEASRR